MIVYDDPVQKLYPSKASMRKGCIEADLDKAKTIAVQAAPSVYKQANAKPKGEIMTHTLSDQQIEEAIQAKNLNAPRVRPQDIEDAIDDLVQVQYHVFPGTTVTVCCVPLKNGFRVVGESAAVSLENFDEEIGRKVALKDAKDKIWPLLGFAMREQIASRSERVENVGPP